MLIKPPPNRGSAALVKINILGSSSSSGNTSSSNNNKNSRQTSRSNNSTTTSSNLQVEFQRQKYNYIPSSQLGEAATKFPKGVFSLTSYPIALHLNHYVNSTGIKTEAEVDKLVSLWGELEY